MNTELGRTIDDLPDVFNAAEDLLMPNVESRPEKAAIIDYRGMVTYRDLYDRVTRMTDVFARLGVTRDQRVLLCLTDTRDFPTVFLGAIRAELLFRFRSIPC
jgi:benzoate-CoA ligase